jgi:DNA polymerase (family X)
LKGCGKVGNREQGVGNRTDSRLPNAYCLFLNLNLNLSLNQSIAEGLLSLMTRATCSNAEIASILDRCADLLEANGENPFRVRSYRTAAQTVRAASQPLAKLISANGIDGLKGLKGIGDKLAGLIVEYVEHGEVELLKGLEEQVAPERLKEIQAKQQAQPPAEGLEIPVEIILEIDREYHEKAEAGKLKKIAPRRFNPDKVAWLPVMTTSHKGYKFTVMYSNTETAHKLGKTDDWVVVYYEKGKGENQCTVVTESRGSMKGKRVIRGREKECAQIQE